jgi:hypothetical protein
MEARMTPTNDPYRRILEQSDQLRRIAQAYANSPTVRHAATQQDRLRRVFELYSRTPALQYASMTADLGTVVDSFVQSPAARYVLAVVAEHERFRRATSAAFGPTTMYSMFVAASHRRLQDAVGLAMASFGGDRAAAISAERIRLREALAAAADAYEAASDSPSYETPTDLQSETVPPGVADESAPASEGTQLGLEVSEQFVIKISRFTNEMRQYELTNADGTVLLDGVGNDRFEALSRVLFRLLLGEDAEPPDN